MSPLRRGKRKQKKLIKPDTRPQTLRVRAERHWNRKRLVFCCCFTWETHVVSLPHLLCLHRYHRWLHLFLWIDFLEGGREWFSSGERERKREITSQIKQTLPNNIPQTQNERRTQVERGRDTDQVRFCFSMCQSRERKKVNKKVKKSQGESGEFSRASLTEETRPSF